MPETIRDLNLMGAILAGLRRECGEDVFAGYMEDIDANAVLHDLLREPAESPTPDAA